MLVDGGIDGLRLEMGQQHGRAQGQLRVGVALSAENLYVVTLASGEKRILSSGLLSLFRLNKVFL